MIPDPLFSIALLKNLTLVVSIDTFTVLMICLGILLFYSIIQIFRSNHSPKYEIDRAEFGLGNGKIILKPNVKDREIAYAIWVELSTRKIGLTIDLNDDVIIEIYESWYSFFSITRDLIKDIPVQKLNDESTRQIIQLSIDVLNDGLRPHLTSWQARFRHWWERALKSSPDDVDPQALQTKYPSYQQLSKDLLSVNSRLIAYRTQMKILVLGIDKPQLKESPELDQ